MGSLPNLADLKRDFTPILPRFRPNSIPGHQIYHLNGPNSVLNQDERKYYNCGLKNRNLDQLKTVYDDVTLEENSGFSAKRVDSMASSITSTSLRRLIKVVKTGKSKNSESSPIYTRRLLNKNLILLFFSHFFEISTFLPFVHLQGFILSDLGSFLMTSLFLFGSISSIFTQIFLKKIPDKFIFIIFYFTLIIFYLNHLFFNEFLINFWFYSVFGLIFGPFLIKKSSFLMILVIKLSQNHQFDDDELKFSKKTCLIRRVSRFFYLFSDLGLIFGSIFCGCLVNFFNFDQFFNVKCGSDVCPSDFNPKTDNSTRINFIFGEKNHILIVFWSSFSIIGVILTIFLNKIESFYEKSYFLTFKDYKLRLLSPLALFIGLEQSFMYSDFTKSYVVCTLGINHLNWVFLFMGLLQSIAAFTLSIIIRNIKRYYIVGVGFTFQCCLLLVLMLWKPINDDPALFYVISAAWGVCNAIWETLNYTFLTGFYVDNFEAAYANQTFFKLIGLALGFGVHNLLCNWVKVYLLALGLILAAISNVWLEIKTTGTKRLTNISRL